MAPRKAPKSGVGKTTRAAPYPSGSGVGNGGGNGGENGKGSGGGRPHKEKKDKLSPMMKKKLLAALRQRIKVPVYGLNILRGYLERANESVEQAYQDFMADFRTAQVAAAPAGTAHAPGGRLPQKLEGIQVNIYPNEEEQRREAVRLLRQVVNVGRDQANQIDMTLNEATMTLSVTGWDVEHAKFRWQSPDAIRWELHLTLDPFRTSTVDETEQDERTARLCNLTGRNDWHSVRQFLEGLQYNLLAAVTKWYQKGIPVLQPEGWDDPDARYFGRRLLFGGRPTPMPTQAETTPANVPGITWPATETSFRPAGLGAPPKGVEAPKKIKTGTNRKRQDGYIIDPDDGYPCIGGVVPSRFVMDYFQGGRYRANEFPIVDPKGHRNPYYFSQLQDSADNDPTNTPFDHFSQKHITHLGRWKRQEELRITGFLKQPPPQPFSREELDYIEELCDGILQDQMASTGKTREELLPLRYTGDKAKSLEDDFNEKFEGETPGGTVEPRWWRSGNSLRSKAVRDAKIRNHFGWAAPGTARGKKKKEEKEEEEEEEEEEEDGSQPLSEGGAPTDSPENSPPGPPSPTRPRPPTAAELAVIRAATDLKRWNMTEEAFFDGDIDASANGEIERLRQIALENAQANSTTLDDVVDHEEIEASIRDMLFDGLASVWASRTQRIIIRHILRGFGIVIPGEEGAEDITPPESPAAADRQRAQAQRERNKAEEAELEDIASQAAKYQDDLRVEAERQFMRAGIEPREDQIVGRMRKILRSEYATCTDNAEHTAVLRSIMRGLFMIMPGEEDAGPDEMDIDEEPVERIEEG